MNNAIPIVGRNTNDETKVYGTFRIPRSPSIPHQRALVSKTKLPLYLLVRRACHNTLFLVRLYVIHLLCSISERSKNSIVYHHCHIDTEDRYPGKVEAFLANLTVSGDEQKVNTGELELIIFRIMT
jgi:hypothetical protein